MKRIELFGIVLFLIYSYFVLHDVDAGGDSVISCTDISTFFNASLASYNSTIQSYYQEFATQLQQHATVNASQPTKDFSEYADVLLKSAQKRISTATYSFFGTISVFIGGPSSEDELSKIIFGNAPPGYPLNCVSNINDPFYAYAIVDTYLNQFLSDILAAHRP